MLHVTSRDESRKEVSVQTPPLAAPKQQVRVAAWNARPMYESGKTAQVASEIRRHNINMLGVSEARWTDSGKISLASGETVCYSGRTDGQHQGGVAIIMDKFSAKRFQSGSQLDPGS